VILAIGQVPDLAFLPDDCAGDAPGQPSPTTQRRWIPRARAGVFAAGDAATGPRSAIEAVAMGHRAAEAIHRYPLGRSGGARAAHRPRGGGGARAQRGGPNAGRRGRGGAAPAPAWPSAPWSVRIGDFNEVALGFTEEQARAEAERCLACGVCSECYRCVDACKPGAIDHALRDTLQRDRGGRRHPGAGVRRVRRIRQKYELGYSRFADVVTKHRVRAHPLGLGPVRWARATALRRQGAAAHRLPAVRGLARSAVRQRVLLLGVLHVCHQGSGHCPRARR
jgi:ferredoxin